MTAMPPLKSAALLILQQRAPLTASENDPEPAGNAVLATANGVAVPTVSGARSQANAKITDALFDGPVNIQELKINLMRRLGHELGLDLDAFADPRDFASAVREVVGKIKSTPQGAMRLQAIEKELGLTKLGISLDDLIDAISSPDGKGGKKLDEALRAETGEDAREGAKAALLLRTDETGLYGV